MQVGDTIQHVETGQRRVIWAITPAGAMGTSLADGPTYHASLPGEDGAATVGGHSLAIWSKSMSSPTRDWVVVEDGTPAPHAWADGFGVWHVRVDRSADHAEQVASAVLREELEAREANLSPHVWGQPLRVRALDDERSIVFREGDPEPHVDYPHEPGRLHDCPACEARCHCVPGETECVFEGEHDARV